MAKEKTEAQKEAEKEHAKRFKDGKMTHYGMTKTLEEGGSVIFQGQHISKVDDLPDEAEIVKGDAEAEEAALRSIDAQRRMLDAQEARLTSNRMTGPTGGGTSTSKTEKK